MLRPREEPIVEPGHREENMLSYVLREGYGPAESDFDSQEEGQLGQGIRNAFRELIFFSLGMLGRDKS